MWVCCSQYLGDLQAACPQCGTTRVQLETKGRNTSVQQSGHDAPEALQMPMVGVLYHDYLRVSKRIFGLSSLFRSRSVDYLEECEGSALRIYSQVHQLRTQIEANGLAVNPRTLEFMKCFDVASGSLASCLSFKRLRKLGLMEASESIRADKEFIFWNGNSARL